MADHSYGVALLAWFLAPEELDRERILEMALLHDLAEVVVGDITPHDKVLSEDKEQKEREALRTLTADLPRGGESLSLLREYQAQKSPEARWVKALDKLDMSLQSWIYEADGEGLDLSEFRHSAAPALLPFGLEAAAQQPPSRGKNDPA